MTNANAKPLHQKLQSFIFSSFIYRKYIKQGQGNQCRTPGLIFKEYIGINRENEINLEETGKTNSKKTEKKREEKKQWCKEGLP